MGVQGEAGTIEQVDKRLVYKLTKNELEVNIGRKVYRTGKYKYQYGIYTSENEKIFVNL